MVPHSSRRVNPVGLGRVLNDEHDPCCGVCFGIAPDICCPSDGSLYYRLGTACCGTLDAEHDSVIAD
jgi:hypothetical protein